MRTTARRVVFAAGLLTAQAITADAQHNGLVPAVTDSGHGANCWVLISGIVGGTAGYGRLEARLLAGGDRVIAIDPFNLSIDSTDVTFAALARRVDRVLDEKGITDARVVGHERGAGVALRLAAMSPQRVRALYFLDAGALATNGSAILSSSLRIVPLIARVPGGRAFIRARLVSGLRENAGVDGWLDEKTQRAYADPLLNDIDRVTAMAVRLGRSREPELVSAVVARVQVRITVIVGDVPHASGPRAPEMMALAPLGDLVRVEHLRGVGHFPHQEAPDAVAALLFDRPLTIARAAGAAP